MDGPSRGPGLSPVRCSVGSLGLFGREAAERGAVSAGATRQRGPAPPRAPPTRPAATHLISSACAGSARRGPRLDRRQARSSRRAPRWPPWARAQISCAWRRSLRDAGGSGRRGEVRGGSALFTAPRAAPCQRFPCPAAEPPGATHFTRARPGRAKGRGRGGEPRPGRCGPFNAREEEAGAGEPRGRGARPAGQS